MTIAFLLLVVVALLLAGFSFAIAGWIGWCLVSELEATGYTKRGR